jgi:hypothetical protein
MAAYTARSRSTEAAVIPTCVSVTMANRRLIARHATWADRYRTGTAWSFSPRHHLRASAHGHH